MVDCHVAAACNNNCVSCIWDTSVPRFPYKPGKTEVEKLDILHFLNKLPLETQIISFTGGEPTLNPDLFELLSYSRAKCPNAFLFLLSNGRRLSYPKYAQKLAQLELKRSDGRNDDFRIAVPLYSHDANVNDAITRARGSFEQAVAGIKNLIGLGFKVELRNILVKQNYTHALEFAKFAASELSGVERVVFINAKYTGNALKNIGTIGVKLTEVVPSVLKALPTLERAGIPCRLFHFPLCVLPASVRPLAEGITKDEAELVLGSQCANCSLQEKCPRIWKSYAEIYGFEEFNTVV